MVIKSIGVLSMGKMMGAVYAAMGLIFGAFVSLISVVGAVAVNQQQGGGAFAPLVFGVGSVVFLPIFYGIIGFVGGIIGAAIYNLVAGVVGGVELDLQPSSTAR
jgi:hypothetical protein